jgi:hypothetical protein
MKSVVIGATGNISQRVDQPLVDSAGKSFITFEDYAATAALCAQAVGSVVNSIAIVSGRRNPIM